MKRLISTIVGSMLMTGVAAAQGVDVSSITMRPDVFPDEYKSPSDGADDAPSIQRAINQLCRKPGLPGSGGIVRLKQHVYEIDSSVTVPCSISMSGTGWEEQMTLGGGSWLHITSKLGVFAPAFNVTTTFARASQFSNFAVTEDMPLPSTVSGRAWSPTPYREVFNLNGVGAAVFFKHILWDGVYRGVAADGAGRIEMDGMYADVFSYLIRLDGSLDVDRIRNVHVWPYWTNSTVSGSAVVPSMNSVQQANVSVWKRTNTDAIVLGRADSPFLDDIFGIDLHSTVRFTNTTSGNIGYATKVKIGKLTCDQSQYCLYVDPGATAASAIIDQLDWQGEDGTNLGHPNTGGAAVKIEGAAFLQIGAVHAEFIGEGIFSVVNPSICSQINVGTVWGNFRWSGSTTPVAYLPACGSGHHTMKVGAYDGIPYPGSTTIYVNGTGTFNLPTLNPNGSGGSNSGGSLPSDADLSLARTRSAGATSLRTNAERNGTALQPQDFLADGQTAAQLTSGQIDAQPAIAAAIAAGTAVTLPCGTYLINEPFPVWAYDGLRLSGAATSCVTLNINFSGTDGSHNLFYLKGHYQTISNLTLNAIRGWSAGAMIYAWETFGDVISNIQVTGPFWNGIYLYAANNTHISNFNFRPPYLSSVAIPNPQNGAAYAGGAAIVLDGDAVNAAPSIDTYLSEGNIAQYQYGIEYIYASGIFENGIDIVGTQQAHLFTPRSGENVNGFQGVNVLGDTSYGPNWHFTGLGGIYEFMCSVCWASSSYSESGVVFDNANVSQINFENSTSLNNSKYGVYIAGGVNIGWVGGAIEMNNTQLGSNADVSDVYLSADSGKLDWIRFQNAFIGRGGIMKYQVGKTNQAQYAVDLAGIPSTTHVTLMGLQTFNHSKGQFNLPASTINIVQTGNQGN